MQKIEASTLIAKLRSGEMRSEDLTDEEVLAVHEQLRAETPWFAQTRVITEKGILA